jgi:hypothetical protein
MTAGRRIGVVALALGVLAATGLPALAQQLSTGTIAGVVNDAQGAAIPGVTVALTSETKGTMVAPVVTNEAGEFQVPNLAPDTYTVDVSLEGFKSLKRTGVAVSGGDRLALGTLTLEVGSLAETITVSAALPVIQTQSGERSFTVPTALVEALPISTNRSFTMLSALAPGVQAALGGNVAAGIQPQRIGGGGAANIMMDGVSTMDLAGNRPSLQMNVESIAEVKVVSSTYQAEYGRSAGVQVMAVTKSGTNRFRGSLYDVERNSKWNANSKTNILNGDPKVESKERDWGYSIGGPVGRPGGANRLFFFYAQEYAPRTIGNDVVRFRVPTTAERQGDFSQSIDNNGSVYNLIRDAATGLPCTAANTAGCFRDGGVVGRIPADRLYGPGVNILRQWPLPNVSIPGAAYNYELRRPTQDQIAWQPAVRLDYNVTQALRASWKYSAWMQKVQPILGSLPGFNDSTLAHPVIDTWAASANYTLSPTTFVEATYGRSRQPQSGCPLATQGTAPIICQTGFPANDIANPANAGLSGLPLIFPDSGLFDPRYLATRLLDQAPTPVYQNGRVLIPPTFAWGTRVANAPPNVPFPGSGGLNGSYEDVINGSLTKVTSRHTIKTGIYYAHGIKYQAQAAGSGAVFGTARGNISFANSANNPFDSTFGFANAALGIFTSYQQLSGWIEGKNSFKNIEGYVQDTWRTNNKLTLDYGLRLVHQQPQHDDLSQGPNFLPDRWQISDAPLLYAAGCANGVYPCSGDNRQAMDPRTGAFLGPGSAVSIGAIIPNTGRTDNGLVMVGNGISDLGFTSPAIGLAPRFGFAYDISGQQTFVLRGGAGVFYSRGFGNFLNGNPPATQDVTIQSAQLQSLGGSVATLPKAGSQLLGWQYDSPYPSDTQWSAGVQMLLPFAAGLDVAYVGHHSWNEIFPVNVGAIDLGSAFLPQNQDRTLAPSATPGAAAVSTPLLAPLRGYNNIVMTTNEGWRTYHGLQLSLQRRFSRGLQFGLNDTITLSDRAFCNAGACPNPQPLRLQHNSDGTYAVRADQAEAEDLLGNARTPTHILKGSLVWDLPDLASNSATRRTVGWFVNNWQVASVWTASTGADYLIAFAYQNGGANVNLTGSPDYAARVRIVGDPGSGCSADPLRQFNTAAFQGPLAGSVGLESGNGYLKSCFQSALDLSLARTFRLPGARTIQFRADIFNAPNQAIVTGRNMTMNLTNPNDPATITNLPVDANGNVIPARARPNGAGFGVANVYQTPRTVQIHIRFGF